MVNWSWLIVVFLIAFIGGMIFMEWLNLVNKKAKEEQRKKQEGMSDGARPERQKAIDEWRSIYCQKCEENNDRGTGYVNCQAECEVQKDVGIACIHYQKFHEQEDE